MIESCTRESLVLSLIALEALNANYLLRALESSRCHSISEGIFPKISTYLKTRRHARFSFLLACPLLPDTTATSTYGLLSRARLLLRHGILRRRWRRCFLGHRRRSVCLRFRCCFSFCSCRCLPLLLGLRCCFCFSLGCRHLRFTAAAASRCCLAFASASALAAAAFSRCCLAAAAGSALVGFSKNFIGGRGFHMAALAT